MTSIPRGARLAFDSTTLNQFTAMFASHFGHIKMARTYRLCGSLWRRYSFLSQYLTLNPKTLKLERRFQFPVEFRTVDRQYGYYRWRFAGDVLLPTYRFEPVSWA